MGGGLCVSNTRLQYVSGLKKQEIGPKTLVSYRLWGWPGPKGHSFLTRPLSLLRNSVSTAKTLVSERFRRPPRVLFLLVEFLETGILL